MLGRAFRRRAAHGVPTRRHSKANLGCRSAAGLLGVYRSSSECCWCSLQPADSQQAHKVGSAAASPCRLNRGVNLAGGAQGQVTPSFAR